MSDQEPGIVEQSQSTSAVDAGAAARNQQISAQLAGLYRVIGNGANWFYWVAGLSIINTVIALLGKDWVMLFGLGATMIFDSLIREVGTKAAIIGLPINLFIACVYVLFGYCASQRMRWAFITGSLFYVLDALLMMGAGYWIGVLFHAWVLFGIRRGMNADTTARRLEAQLLQQTA